MKSFALLAIAGLASAQVYTCDGNRRPNWEDCATVVSDFAMDGNPDVFHQNGLDDPAPSCKWWYKNDGNCRITHCFQDEDTTRTISGGQIWQLYDQIRSRCVGFRAGGEFTGALEYVDVFNDEDQAPEPARKRGVKIEHDNGLVEETLTLEEYQQWLNDTTTAREAKRDAAVASALKPRQLDGDNQCTIDFTAISVRNPDVYTLGPRLSSGVGYTYETSESESYGVTTSVSMGGQWEIFSASASVETSYEQTYTVTEGLTFDVNCPNQGQITFYPLYDYYETHWDPSGTKVNIYVPVVTGDSKISGEISVACLG